MSTVEDLSSDERRAYDLITSRDGLLQSELWKALDANSRKGSRLARSLVEEGLIEREETVSDGRTTYLLKPTNGETPATTGSGGEVPEVSESEEEDELEPRAERALSLVQENNGIYQSDLWKELDVTSRTGSRIATNLAEKGLIQREEATYNGQRTYFLKPAKKDIDFSLLMAGDEIFPFIGSDEEEDPIESNEFTQWVLKLAPEEN